MHPIFSSRFRFGLYLAGWFTLAPCLAAILALLGPRPYAEALAYAGPLTLFYASACLSAWYVCRSHPLGTTAATRLMQFDSVCETPTIPCSSG